MPYWAAPDMRVAAVVVPTYRLSRVTNGASWTDGAWSTGSRCTSTIRSPLAVLDDRETAGSVGVPDCR